MKTKKNLKNTAQFPKLNMEVENKKIAEIRNPVIASDQKDIYSAVKSLFLKHGLFDRAFEASELMVEADRKLYSLISQSGLTDKCLAETFNSTKTASSSLRHDLKRAYERPSNEIQALKEKAFRKKELLSRKWFIREGQLFTKNPEWNTPAWIYERARIIMGSIDLDPATNLTAIEQGNTATRYFTKEDDALKQDWGDCGNVFCNPPYSIPRTKIEGTYMSLSTRKILSLYSKRKLKKSTTSGACAFLEKLLNSNFKQCIFVTIEDSGTSYGQELWTLSSAIFIPRNRIAFSGKHGNMRSSIVWGIKVNENKFRDAFQLYGQVIMPHKNPYLTVLDIDDEYYSPDSISFGDRLKSAPEP